MLTFDEIREEVTQQMQYWPQWSLSVDLDPFEGPYVIISTTQADARRPGAMTTLNIKSFLPPMPDVDYLGLWMRWRLCRIAAHESAEGFTHRGKRIHDPHDMEFQ